MQHPKTWYKHALKEFERIPPKNKKTLACIRRVDSTETIGWLSLQPEPASHQPKWVMKPWYPVHALFWSIRPWDNAKVYLLPKEYIVEQIMKRAHRYPLCWHVVLRKTGVLAHNPSFKASLPGYEWQVIAGTYVEDLDIGVVQTLFEEIGLR